MYYFGAYGQFSNRFSDPGPSPLGRHVLAASTALIGVNVLHLVTRGAIYSPDLWGDFYAGLLLVYAGVHEGRRWMTGTDATCPDIWQERLQKGGPLITAWCSLLGIAGLARVWDPTIPMPPELVSTTLKVMGVFSGTALFRQYRRRVPLGKTNRTAAAAAQAVVQAGDFSEDATDLERLYAHLKANGASRPADLGLALRFPRRTLARLLNHLETAGRIRRDAASTTDPSATYEVVNP